MNIKYFMTTFATFVSISVAQGSPFLSSQKFIQNTSASRDHFFGEQLSKILSEVFQIELSCGNNGQCLTSVELVPVSYSGKKRGQNPRGRRGRPSLFTRGPMSF
ncbi:hypothetical protein [Bartonella rattimassiliensis]|uniref:Uncharacterized protein n=1 Tax=Bartonella rattimassiliensis 15908 TaxID=1094556 RepID=J1JGF6_9HYPH|nr:hypothetical protein [Bartonella rattimassiliensis]EJF83617.1 hypothetical protein MCY_01201 [Bartonella rattimassiliensis 15908]